LAPTPTPQRDEHGLLIAQLRFDYQGCVGWWLDQPLSVMVENAAYPGGQVLLQRDGRAELDAIDRLLALGLQGIPGGDFCIPAELSQQPWLHWADGEFAVLQAADFALTLDAALQGWVTHAEALNVQLQPSGSGDSEGLMDDGDAESSTSPWFDLSLGIEINGQRRNILSLLPALIDAAAAHPLDPATGLPVLPPYVYLPALDGGSFVRLPTDALRPWMAALLELVGDRSYDFSGDHLRLSRLDALRTSAALGEGIEWQGAAALRAMVQSLHGGALPEVPVPVSVQAQLRPYQQQGLNWLQFLRTHGLAGVLADDMGLGKTLQTLVHIQVEKDAGRLTHPALIIAPVSLMGNWQHEAARFCPQLRCLVLHGKDRHAVADAITEHDVVIAPYSLLQRDRARWLAAQWHIVVLDEAQNIKNAHTHAAQVVGQLQAKHRLCLSGTPMENHLGEIWSLFHFLMPGFLGSSKRFSELFRVPIEKQGNSERLAQLRARVTPFMLRRTKALVAHELPPKIETVVQVQLSGAQADLYETIRLGMEKTVREALANKGLAKSQITILDALLKLRQVCCDPRLLSLDVAKKVTKSAKLEQLMEMLSEMLAEGRRVLLFSQFTTMLTLIEVELKKRQLSWVKLTGQSQKRDQIIERFTSGEVPLFLISLKAGGVGLNLPQADTVIHYDPWWNPAVEQQATDRAHRIGQTQSVWVLKLVAQGTIEERILVLQERKAQLAGGLYSETGAEKVPLFTESDVAQLLQPLFIQ
jgi:superfamily II DNA or RNA helicase